MFTTLATVAAAAPRPAFAQPSPAATALATEIALPSPLEPEYAAQIVLADLAGAAATLGLASVTGSSLSLIPVALSAPAVHLAHDQPARAAGSLGLHIATPLLGAAVGYQIEAAGCEPNEWLCGLTGTAIGLFAGYATAMVVDATFLARPYAREGRAAPRRASVLPTVAVNRGGVALGLQGAF